jgi:hypothetical protein
MTASVKYTEQELLDAVGQCSIDTEQDTTERVYRQWREEKKSKGEQYPTAGTIVRRIGWQNALRRSPHCSCSQPSTYPESAYAFSLNFALESLDADEYPLTQEAYRGWRENQPFQPPSTSAIREHFGSWREALCFIGAAHAVHTNQGPSQRYSEKDCAAALRQAVDVFGGPMKTTAYDKWRRENRPLLPSSYTIKKRLGGWQDAFEHIGIRYRPNKEKSYTREEKINALRQARRDIGEPFTIERYDKWRNNSDQQHPTSDTIYSDFDGWKNALIEAGIGIPRPHSRTSPMEALSYEVLRLYEETGSWPDIEQYESQSVEAAPSHDVLYSNTDLWWDEFISVLSDSTHTHSTPRPAAQTD